MLLYSTPPLPGCSSLHKVKGSNGSSSFPLFLCFLFNYSQAVQVLLSFLSPYAALSSWGFSVPNCAFGLSPIPFSPVCAPCSAQICCLCSLCCAHMLALPPLAATPCSWAIQCPFASCRHLCQGAHQKRKDFAMAPAPVSCCRLLSTAQGEPMLLP